YYRRDDSPTTCPKGRTSCKSSSPSRTARRLQLSDQLDRSCLGYWPSLTIGLLTHSESHGGSCARALRTSLSWERRVDADLPGAIRLHAITHSSRPCWPQKAKGDCR